MTILISLLVALALGIDALLMFRNCAETSPIRLSLGLIIALIVGASSALLMGGGFLLANLFDYMGQNGNATVIFMGFFVFVVIKLLITHRRKEEAPSFDISQWSIVGQLALVQSINALFLGLGMGYIFIPSWTRTAAWIICFLFVFAFSYWGIMLGRNKIEMRQRRWRIMEILLLLAAAILGLFVR